MKVKKKFTRMGKPKPSSPKPWRGRVARRRAHVKLKRRKERSATRRRREELRAAKRGRRRRPRMMMSRLLNEHRDREYQRRIEHSASLKRDGNGRFLPKRSDRRDDGSASKPVDP